MVASKPRVQLHPSHNPRESGPTECLRTPARRDGVGRAREEALLGEPPTVAVMAGTPPDDPRPIVGPPLLLRLGRPLFPSAAAALKYDRCMRRRGTARFVCALIVSYVIYETSFSRSLEAGHAALGGWGLVAAVVLLGFGMALVFTAIYDGPVALRPLLKREDATVRLNGPARRGEAGSP